MSSATINPISPTRFAAALQDLPLDALHAKAAELLHSISHLRDSNAQMLPFAEDGDQDCKEAMFENLGVIGRMNERIALLRAEVEGRGMPWGQEEGKGLVNGDGRASAVNGDAGVSAVDGEANGVGTRTAPEGRSAPSGRLTDEELRRQMEARMMGGGEDEGEEDGVHL